MVELRNKIAALAVSAVALAGGLVMASPASAATSCSGARGVEVWEYSNYGGGCVMFQSNTADTHGINYPDGNSVFYTAGTAENNYPWTVKLCYDANGGGGVPVLRARALLGQPPVPGCWLRLHLAALAPPGE